MKRSDHLLVGVVAGILTLASGAAAHAFCRTSSCPGVGTSQVCTPMAPGDCGVPLFWAKPCVGFSVAKAASKMVTFDQTATLLNDAFQTWMDAACPGGGHPRMLVTESAPVECARHEYNQMAGNANIILFHDDKWPYEGSPNTLALTTVTYNLDTGEIYDADMELNSADNHLTVGDTNVDFDLASIVTHEAGHFLGLAHSPDVHAVMFPDYMEHTTNLRNLSADDIAGICTIYPPGDAVPSDCDTTPRHGFSPLCADQQAAGEVAAGGCCAVAGGGAPGGGAGMATALAVLGLSARRRRKRTQARG